jgi:2-keto-4-pentenoate hydratase/2-oxohepta-3-ene-1,7-dioic acid hydratase in catechol pathway
VPGDLIIFTKALERVIARREAIRYPIGLSDSIDHEVELGVVVGEGRGIVRDDALGNVFGYTIITGVTARDLHAKNKQ